MGDALDSGRMTRQSVTYIPGLYKIFDEILVNAADNRQRDINCNRIDIEIDLKEGCISIKNNGAGIPVEFHKVEKLWLPDMLFGHLLTSSNYQDEIKKVTGVRNGYGAKLCNMYSSEFTIETVN